jgi:hypothetical protein
MRNAQKAALMAMFAAMEDRGDEAERELEDAKAREAKPRLDRLIQVDLSAIAQAKAKMPA